MRPGPDYEKGTVTNESNTRYFSWFVSVGLALGAYVVVSVSAFADSAHDWAQWRGPQRDGLVTTFEGPKIWPETLKLKWKVEVGAGHFLPVLAGNRVYLLSRQDEQEVIAS